MKHITPIKAIRLKCLDCWCGSYKEVRLCLVKDCPLHPYRHGKRLPTSNRPSFAKKTQDTSGVFN